MTGNNLDQQQTYQQRQNKQEEEEDPTRSTTSLLFLALHHLFVTLRPTSLAHVPITRTAAFASRLIIASTHLPSTIALPALQFIHKTLLIPHPPLDSLLSSEDRIHTGGGTYRADIDDVQVCNPFGGCWYSLSLLTRHADGEIREIACQISDFIR
jgi:nucleolar complex protein 3